MQKIVINRCFGGFGLSEAAARLLQQRRPELCIIEYQTRGDSFSNATTWLDSITFAVGDKRYYYPDSDEMPRNDADLIAVVEKLGAEAASGRHAALAIVEIPDDVEWTIEEYDGHEHVAEKHRTWR